MTTTIGAADLLGQHERRIDGRDKVTGRAQYTADVQRPGMLCAAFATSPYAHARIRSIDVAAARAVPGVRAVLTGEDIGRRRFGRMLHDWPVLAWDRVLMVGDRVAAVAAETREAAEEAARRIAVTYDDLPPVLDPAGALAPDAPVLHPDRAQYFHAAFAGREPPALPHPNVQGMRRFTRGEPDLDARFASAAHVFEHVYHTPRHHAGYIEPRSTLVWVDDDDRIHVQSPNKIPFWLRGSMARCLDVPAERIVVEPSLIGGDFGGKGMTVDEVPCYFLARATGRPVRYVQSYLEELGSAPTRHAATIRLRTAVDRDGRFIAHRSDVVFDGGAYAGGKVLPWLTPGFGYSAVPYAIPDIDILVRAVYTNQVPGAHVRAPVDVQVFFAWEQHVDAIAQALDVDPIDLRLRNLVAGGAPTLNGEIFKEVNAPLVLETLRREAKLDEPLPPGRARGVALTCRHTGGRSTSIKLRRLTDGRIEVITGVTEQGSGMLTMLQRVTAATLGIDPALVDVRRENTADALNDAGTGGSWVTHVHGRAVQQAAEEVRAQLEACGGNPDGVLEVSASYNGDHGPDHAVDGGFSAYAIDVAVDRETGAIDVVGATVVCDVGAILNPVGHQGQLEGGFAFGIGSALLEELAIDESGKVETLSLGEYKLPTIADMPPLRTVLVRGGDGEGPFGAKMAGELTNPGVAPAIANAVARAAGVRIDRMPLTAERVYDALRGAGG